MESQSSGGGDAASASSGTRRRPRPSRQQVCLNCSRSKVKCEKTFPCARCVRLGLECEDPHFDEQIVQVATLARFITRCRTNQNRRSWQGEGGGGGQASSGGDAKMKTSSALSNGLDQLTLHGRSGWAVDRTKVLGFLRTLVQILLQYGHDVEDIIPYVGEKLAQSLGTDLETLAEEFRQRQAWHRSVFPLAFRPMPLAPTTHQYFLSDDPTEAAHPFALELFQQNALAAIMWLTIHGRNRLYCNATFEANFFSQAEGNQLMDRGALPPELVSKVVSDEDKQELALLWDACLFLESGHCTQGSHVLKCYSQRYDKSFLGLVHFRSVMMNDGDYLLGTMAVQPLPLPIDLLSPRPQGLQPNTSSLSDDSSGDESEAVVSLAPIPPPTTMVPPPSTTTTTSAAPMSTNGPSWGPYAPQKTPNYPATISAPLPQSTALPTYQHHQAHPPPPPPQPQGPNPHAAFPPYYYMDQHMPPTANNKPHPMWGQQAAQQMSYPPVQPPPPPHPYQHHLPNPMPPMHQHQHQQPTPQPLPMDIAQAGMTPGQPQQWNGPVTEDLLLTWEALEALQSET